MHHLSSIADLSAENIRAIFSKADELKAMSATELNTRLQHRILANLFFEPSTRTRLSFESAAKQLGMHVLTMNEHQSSRVKGETYLDTLITLQAVGAEIFVIRSKDEKICNELAIQMSRLHPNTHIINGGGGTLNHPTQGLLDVYTMLQHHSDLESAKIVIVGDIKHSRVARSTCQCLNALGITNISLVAPQHLLPEASEFTTSKQGTDLDTALENADIVMALRIQKERMLDGEIPDNDSYHQRYGINSQRLEKTCPQALVMHPGPMNRGVEISSELADSQRSLISAQVNNGLFIRMALFDLLLNKQ